MEKQAKSWTYHEGKALISIYEKRKEEYYQTKNKKDFWETVLAELEALDALVSPTTAAQVEIKWRSLVRAYKKVKDRGTGGNPSKFLYLEQMERILRDDPCSSSPQSVSVGIDTCTLPASFPIKRRAETPEVDTTRISGKRGKYQENLLQLKKDYYNRIIEEKEKKRKMLQRYLKKKEKAKEKRHLEICELLKKANASDTYNIIMKLTQSDGKPPLN